MTLVDKIKQIHPSLTDDDFTPEGTIMLQDDSNGQGAYIKSWNHPTLAKPTEEQLGAIE